MAARALGDVGGGARHLIRAAPEITREDPPGKSGRGVSALTFAAGATAWASPIPRQPRFTFTSLTRVTPLRDRTREGNLQTGALVPLTLDEQGRTITSTAYFWTGMTDDASTSSIGTCSSWTSATTDGAVGSLTELSRPNTGIGAPNYCAYSNRLLCLEL